MRTLLSISLVVIAAVAPVAGFSQQPAHVPLTRADVRAQIAQTAQDHRMQAKVHDLAMAQPSNLTRPSDTGYGNLPGGSSGLRTMPSLNAVSSSARAAFALIIERYSILSNAVAPLAFALGFGNRQ